MYSLLLSVFQIRCLVSTKSCVLYEVPGSSSSLCEKPSDITKASSFFLLLQNAEKA